MLFFRVVQIAAFPAIFADPMNRFGEFLRVVNPALNPADKFHHIHKHHPHPEESFKKGHIHNRAGNAHRSAAHGAIGLPAQCRRSEPGFGELEQHRLHIGGNRRIASVLHVAPVDIENRIPLLIVGRCQRREINCARPLGAIETPDGFRRERVHVHRLTAVTPAGRDGQRNADAFFRKFLRTQRRFRNAADTLVRDHAFHFCAIGMPEVLRQELGRRFGHGHGLFFQRLANAAEPAVNRWANSNFWVRAHESILGAINFEGSGHH